MSKKIKKPKATSFDKVIISVLAVSTVVSALMLINYKNFFKNREYEDLLDMDIMYNNIFINNYEVAGLTKEQALEKLERELQKKKFENKCIYLQLPNSRADERIELTYAELGMQYDFQPAIDEAYQYGRTGSDVQRRADIDELENRGQFFTAEYSHDRQKILETLKKYEQQVNEKLTDGKKMNVERTADIIEELLNIDSHDAVVNIPVK